MKTLDTFILSLVCEPNQGATPMARLRHVVSNQEYPLMALSELGSFLETFLAEKENSAEVMQHEQTS
ncbi:MAG: hypothetical protein D6775_00895 [Caldilineae bacterium]|nr:MAG: hypothetical protein D6775_00895 [Caldilineae bacterium]